MLMAWATSLGHPQPLTPVKQPHLRVARDLGGYLLHSYPPSADFQKKWGGLSRGGATFGEVQKEGTASKSRPGDRREQGGYGCGMKMTRLSGGGRAKHSFRTGTPSFLPDCISPLRGREES